jgi:hypothetical protein
MASGMLGRITERLTRLELGLCVSGGLMQANDLDC